MKAGTKRKININGEILEITPYGAGSEVGRSCILLSFQGKTIMLDCGIHPAYNGLQGLPFFDEIEDTSKIDLLLVSHFHLDHSAALPYFLEKTDFKGRVYMTYPTKAIYKMLLSDYMKVTTNSQDENLFTEKDLSKSLKRIELIDYHQEVEYKGIKFWCYNAGHVLGAAMFLIEIGGVRILYTGDYSREEDRHLMAAEIPKFKPDVLIIESTYGTQKHAPRIEREEAFTQEIKKIVERGGRCLVPVFALGRAQELLLILDEFWSNHPNLHQYPIYYASALAKKCMKVYKSFVFMMNEKIKKRVEVSNPFNFKHISPFGSIEDFIDRSPSVVFASPAMLQSGISRDLFERWCTDSKNGVIIPGYCVEGTLAKKIMSEPKEIESQSGQKLPLRMTVKEISFSAHADYRETKEFVDILQPPYIVLVHGDSNQMLKLKKSLDEIHKEREQMTQIFTPKNCETVKLTFVQQKIAKSIGKSSGNFNPQVEGFKLSGLLVKKEFDLRIMSAEDLSNYTMIKTSIVNQKLVVPYHSTIPHLFSVLHQMYDEITFTFPNSNQVLSSEKMHLLSNNVNCLFVSKSLIIENKIASFSPPALILKWKSNPITDLIADSVAAIVINIHSHPLPSEHFYHSHTHSHSHSHGDEKGENKSQNDKVLTSILVKKNYQIVDEKGIKKEKEDIMDQKEDSPSIPKDLSPLQLDIHHKIEFIFEMLKLHYDKIEMDLPSFKIKISTIDGNCVLSFDSDNDVLRSLYEIKKSLPNQELTLKENPTVECENVELKNRVFNLLNSIITSIQPLSLSIFDL
eukprot:TRINITY_DN13824_c0_g1_i1.p1 TRINITY_DN13824_c0_g1~~TRINITY_DN13824_c0_g1_i1.p1  ORF type:complete len:798 (-),score=235.32 TRINITY_DN13824_c0_g1_i1:42-2435(-)